MEYSEIFKKIQEKKDRKYNDHILLIDGTNTLIRSFALVKSLNSEGVHTGGVTGFLRSLGFLVRTIDPTRVICVFDSKGSSTNRKNLDSNYKAQREHTRITNWGIYESKEEEREALFGQFERLDDYLKYLPLHTITVHKAEADDIIAYLAKQASSSNKKCTIVSSDKDFLQLINKDIEVFSPVKKVMITENNIKDEIGVLPQNYNIVKALTGDRSDNLEGVRGAGIKTIISCFPELVTHPGVNMDYIYEVCSSRIGEKKIYANIIYEWDKVESNYKLMNLHETIFSADEKDLIQKKITSKLPEFNPTAFIELLDEDKIEGFSKDPERWLEIFKPLSLVKK